MPKNINRVTCVRSYRTLSLLEFLCILLVVYGAIALSSFFFLNCDYQSKQILLMINNVIVN